MQKHKFFLLVVTLFSLHGLCQFNPPNPTAPSANLAGSKENIQIGTDLNNGKVNVSVPLLNYEFEGIQFPVALSYAGGNGLTTDELPSWAGLGWNLTAGGYIHRTVRGKPDETRDFATEVDKYGYVNGIPQTNEKITTLHAIDYSYFGNLNKLGGSNWYTQANANTLQPSASNYSYSLPYGNGTKAFHNHHPWYDLAPDEFTFSIGGISGKFYFNHLGEWVVQSSDGVKYSVSVNQGELWRNSYQKVQNIIRYITLTSDNGVKYYFGNSDVTAPFTSQYFDYSHSSSTIPIDINEMLPTPGATLLDIVAHTWHLSKIENLKTGSVITFNYKFAGWQFYKSRQSWGNEGGVVYNNYQLFGIPGNPNSLYRLSAVSKVATRAWTVLSINFPNNIKIEFESTQSTQLSSTDDLQTSDHAGFYEYDDMWSASGDNSLLKLDRIQLKYGTEIKSEIIFSFSSIANQRMKLNSVKKGSGPGLYDEEYSFTYNSQLLPAYAAGKSDHWGFYNNKDFFASVAAPYDYTKLLNYNSYREPDYAYVQAEILTSVKLPTGGKVLFEYQPHDYSKKLNTDFSISTTANTQGGGVRIYKITHKANDNEIAYEKIYDYVVPGTQTSSGILSTTSPEYLIGNSSSFNFRAVGFNPVFYSGSPVTYTYVKERQVNNGYTLYQYSNYDNGFNDEAPVQTNTSTFTKFSYAYKNNAYKRGKLMLAQVFAENGTTPVSQKQFTYEHSNSETNKPEVRNLYYKEQGTLQYWYTSVSERVYQDNVISTEEKTFANNSNITDVKNVTYDQYGNISQTITYDSKGQAIRKKFKYCQEYSSLGTDNVSLGIKYLKDLGIKSALIEEITYRENSDGSNSYVTAASLNTYKTNSPFTDKSYRLQITSPLAAGSFTESTVSGSSFVKDSRYSTEEIQFATYDGRGNIQQFSLKNNIKNAFQWDYDQSYQTVKIVNAENTKRTYTQYVQGTVNGNFAWYPGQFHLQTANFQQAYTGNISISVGWGGYPGSATVYLNYNLGGPSPEYGTLCISMTGGCSYPPTIVFNNKPPGQYSLSVSISSNYSVSVTASYSYQGNVPQQVTEGIKEFYYEGFEQPLAGATGIQNPYAGKKYYEGDFQVPYQPESAKNYKVNYHYLESGIWKNMTVNYSYPMTLTNGDAIDEVRVYPSDALMTSYTYNPFIGLTSETDPNGKSVFYEYDNLNRLKLIRNDDKNILKQFDYKYQFEVCGADWQNTLTAVRCKQVNGLNTGEQEQEQKDMNPCSPTYNTTQWVVIGTNTTACPLPAVYARLSVEPVYYGYGYTSANVTVRFYSDQAGTIPVSVNNLTINYAYDHGTNGVYDGTTNIQKIANGTSQLLEYWTTIYLEYYDFGYPYWEDWIYYLQPGSGYTIIY